MPFLTYQEIIHKIDQLEESNILLSALQLRIFTILEKKGMLAREVSQKARITYEGSEVLLNALAAMGALKKRGNKFKNTPETYKHFSESSPHYKKGTVMLKKENRDEFAALNTIIQKGRDLTAFDGGDDPKFRELFTHAMHERSTLYAEKVARVVARKSVGRLIDLGCGPGSYSAAILKKDRKATATLLDRPAAIKVARQIHKGSPVFKRFKFIRGDLHEKDFGEGYDTVLFSNVLHIYNPRENQFLFKKIHRALNLGKRFILYDLFLKDNQTEPYDAALFALTMLLFTKTGKSYTYRETETMMRSAGFRGFKRFEVGYGTSLIEGIKK